jgi:hypothetical protein
MLLFNHLLKKNLEKKPTGFEDIIKKLDDSFSIKKYEVKTQVEHEDKIIKPSME